MYECIIRLIKLRYRREAAIAKYWFECTLKDVVISAVVSLSKPSLKYHWIPLWINLIKWESLQHGDSIPVIYRNIPASLMRRSISSLRASSSLKFLNFSIPWDTFRLLFPISRISSGQWIPESKDERIWWQLKLIEKAMKSIPAHTERASSLFARDTRSEAQQMRF